MQQLGRELNVNYVLEGSVQRGANRLRVNVQLIDAETRAHLWADRFDKPMTDLFEMQDEIVATACQRTGCPADRGRSAPRGTLPASRCDRFVFPRPPFAEQGNYVREFGTSSRFFERALELDPTNIEALVGKANIDLSTATNFMVDDRDARFAAAEATLIKVLSMAPSSCPWLICHLGFSQLFTKRATQAIGEFEQALALDRNLATAHA